LVAQAGCALIGPLFGFFRFALDLTLTLVVTLEALALLVIAALVPRRVLLPPLAVRLALLLRLVYSVQDAEVMFRMLEERFRRHSVTATGGVAAELQVFLEKLLGRAAYADFGTVAVENVVTIERNSPARMVADGAARSSTATTTAGAMVAATHALHVHIVAVELSHCRWTWGVGRPIWASPGLPLANHDPSALMMAREGP
jgi:hypothetical protein